MKETETKKWTGFDLFNQVPVNIAVIDRNYQIVDANTTFSDSFVGPWEWKGKKCFQVFKNRQRVCKECPATKTFADGKVRVFLEKVRDRKLLQRECLLGS